MFIELELVNKGHDYKITITKSKNKSLNIDIFENGKSLLESKLNKEAKEVLVKIF
jgi:LAS superfamily LD-carboxypeptidase LdcB